MHIIFGSDVAELRDKYPVLELDTLYVDGKEKTAYCVVETVPLDEISRIVEFSNLHANLIAQYRQRNWNYCEQAIEHLHGRWAGTLNSFYEDMSKRIKQYKQNDPGPDWNGVLQAAGS
jgi:hypothetical protein